jgi:hypothetical protein
VALAAFFYRNFGFSTPPPAGPSPFDLPPMLAQDFRFSADDADFTRLFHDGIPDTEMDWFEPLTDPEPEWE